MLKGIDPLLGPGLLRWLAQMGHGDVLCIADRNFPCYGAGQERVWQMTGVGADEALAAVLTLFPVDSFVPTPVTHMLTDDGTDGPALPAVRAVLDRAEGREVGVRGIGRHGGDGFYARSARAYATIRTSETRPYACYLIEKGVVA